MSIRILAAQKKGINESLVIKMDGVVSKTYTIRLYDECIKWDNDFDLKYSNIIIKSIKIPKNVNINSIIVPIYNNIQKEKYYLSVCITAMYNYDAKLMLNQLIEIYTSLGVNHFTIYYSSSSNDVLNILRKYINEEKVNLIYWERNNNTIRMRNHGQYIKINDCLYRYMGVSKYIINTDLDEIIIPLKYKSLVTYIKQMRIKKANITIFIFSCKMFIKNDTIDKSINIKKSDYLYQHKTTDVNIFKLNKCCYSRKFKKYIVKTDEMNALQVHYAWSGNINIFNVPYDEGYSRHSRRMAIYLHKECKYTEFDYNLSTIFPYLYAKYIN